MQYVAHLSKLIEIFCSCDDFCLLLKKYQATQLPDGSQRRPTREPDMSESEMMCIAIFYHLSGFKCFEYYYRQLILGAWKSYFPKAVSYERFVALMPRCIPLVFLYTILYRCGKQTGIYYADSKKLPVCDNRRIHQNRVFIDWADRGKSSTGWFFGFKLFLVVNQYGQVMRCQVTKASKADNNYDWMIKFFKGLKAVLSDKKYRGGRSHPFFLV